VDSIQPSFEEGQCILSFFHHLSGGEAGALWVKVLRGKALLAYPTENSCIAVLGNNGLQYNQDTISVHRVVTLDKVQKIKDEFINAIMVEESDVPLRPCGVMFKTPNEIISQKWSSENHERGIKSISRAWFNNKVKKSFYEYDTDNIPVGITSKVYDQIIKIEGVSKIIFTRFIDQDAPEHMRVSIISTDRQHFKEIRRRVIECGIPEVTKKDFTFIDLNEMSRPMKEEESIQHKLAYDAYMKDPDPVFTFDQVLDACRSNYKLDQKSLKKDIVRFAGLHSWYKYNWDPFTTFYAVPWLGEMKKIINMPEFGRDRTGLHWHFIQDKYFCPKIFGDEIYTISKQYPVYITNRLSDIEPMPGAILEDKYDEQWEIEHRHVHSGELQDAAEKVWRDLHLCKD